MIRTSGQRHQPLEAATYIFPYDFRIPSKVIREVFLKHIFRDATWNIQR